MKKLMILGYVLFASIGVLYSKNCEILVIGTERSGTKYMSTLLKNSGYDVGHERFGKDGSVSWPMVVNQYQPWMVSSRSRDHFKHIFHQVRDPLNVITSIVTNFSDDMNEQTWQFKRKFVPQMDPLTSPIIQSAEYWYQWNLMAEKKAEWRYRIEDFPKSVYEFERRSGIKISRKALAQLSKHHHRMNPIKQTLTWQDLKTELPEDLYNRVSEMAKRYGYPTLETECVSDPF